MTKDEVEAIAARVFDDRFARWKWLATGFLVGFGALVVIGIAWPDFRDFVLRHLVTEEVKESIRGDEKMRSTLADEVIGVLGERIDSGYARTIYFGPGASRDSAHNLLQFYAREHQRVVLALRAQSSNEAAGEYVVTIDNTDIFQEEKQEHLKYPHPFVTLNIDKFLKRPSAIPLESGEAGNIHTVRIMPINLKPPEAASFELVVLVRNEKATKKT